MSATTAPSRVRDPLAFEHDDSATSASKIEDLNACLRLFAFKHVEGLEDDSRAAQLGRVVHAAIADAADIAVHSGLARIPVDAVQAAVRATDPSLVAEARELVTVAAEILDLSHVAGIEKPWLLELGGGRRARGRVDLRTHDPEWSDLTVIDVKTGHVVKHRRLEDSPAAILYLAGEHARSEWRGRPPRVIRYVEVWLRLRHVTPGLEWTPEIDERARTIARSALETVERETRAAAAGDPKAWAPNPGPACRVCPFIDRCSAHREDAPATDAHLSLEEVARRAQLFRARAKAWAARADELEAHLRAVAALAGPFDAGEIPVGLKARAGRRTWPTGDVLPTALSLAGLPVEGPLVRADGRLVAAAIKALPRERRGEAWALVDRYAPRGLPSQRLVLGGELEDEEEDEA